MENRKVEEYLVPSVSGYLAALLFLMFAMLFFVLLFFAADDSFVFTLMGWVSFLFAGFFLSGITILQPNQAAVLLLFGKYAGTLKATGLMFINPFKTKKIINLRSRNLNGAKLKVNDKSGNPIEIAVVVVWKVSDAYKALFEVEDYEKYVQIHSESCIRHIAGKFNYDVEDGSTEISLRGDSDEVSMELRKELQLKLEKAGVVVEEARISHLAYSPEIASAMLKRQQANAIIAARAKIVDGAVGMVEMAINKLAAQQVVNLNAEQKAVMVSNLMVVLCGEKEAQPVINTDSI